MPEWDNLDLARITMHPGYRAILRTVLKTQIKQLVEQLSFYAGEEAILLSASITDGTLSHVGSKFGEIFINQHEEVKSQFLGFCLTLNTINLCQEILQFLCEYGPRAPGHNRSKEHEEKRNGEPSVEEIVQAKAESSSSAPGASNEPTSGECDSPPAKKPRPNKRKKQPVKVITLPNGSKIQQEQSLGVSTDSWPNNEDNGLLMSNNYCNDVCNDVMSMLEHMPELSSVVPSSPDVGVRQGESHDSLGGLNGVDRNNEEQVLHNTGVTCDGDTAELPDAGNETPRGMFSENLLIVKEEPRDSEEMVDGAIEGAPGGAPGVGNESTIGQGQQMGFYQNQMLQWTAANLLARYTKPRSAYTKKRKLNTLSIEQKYEALMQVEAGNRRKSDIAKEFNVPTSTLSTWIKSKDTIKYNYLRNDYNPKRKNVRRSNHPDIDNVLLDWARDAKIHEIQVSSILLMEKANEVARELGYSEEAFNCTQGWVERFKSRYGLTIPKKKYPEFS